MEQSEHVFEKLAARYLSHVSVRKIGECDSHTIPKSIHGQSVAKEDIVRMGSQNIVDDLS